MKQDSKRELKPKVRFPEFRDAPGWGKQRLVDACRKITQGGTPDTSNTEYWNGAIYWLTPADMGKSDSTFIDCTARTLTELGLENCSSELLPVRSIIISTRAPIGHLAINTRPMAINQGCRGLIPNKNLNYAFLYSSLSSARPQLLDLGAGNTFKELSGQSLKNFTISVPWPDEQQKIADCLSSLDDVIAAQGRKVDALKAHKKGLMQQLFPREGENLPRLRFPEFRSGPRWQMKKLGTLLLETPRPIELDDDKSYSLVTVKRRYGGVVSRGVLQGKAIKVKAQFLVEANDFLISKRQIVHDACGLVPKDLEGSVVSNEYSVLTPKKGCDIEFFNYFSQQPCVSDSFLQSSVGIVIEKMLFKLDYWLKREFLIPSLQEQRRIATCLASAESQIAAQAKKLDALKTHKKGLMQQLFPSPEEVDA